MDIKPVLEEQVIVLQKIQNNTPCDNFGNHTATKISISEEIRKLAETIIIFERHDLDGEIDKNKSLQAENTQLKKRLAAALEQMQHSGDSCGLCKYGDGIMPDDTRDGEEYNPCLECEENGGNKVCWEWCGEDGE